ncbi:MAG TPA: DUF3471 domain-containing protein [Blastocatellia bacterium]|nr:DUF3471 domain-containing protein [Blastocatellia bacterium]
MKSIKIAISLIFIAGLVAAFARETLGYPPLLAKAKKFGAKDCTFCHVDPEGGPPWNERGQWLIKEKERRGAETVDVEWLADYKPGKVEAQKPADAAKAPDAAKADDKKPSTTAAPAGKADPKTFDDYVGEYEAPIGILVITHEGDKLFGQPQGDTKQELKPEDDGSFSVTNVGAKLRFNRDEKGKVVEFVIKLNDQEMKGKKIK